MLQEEVIIPAGKLRLKGSLVLSDQPRGIIIFSHGSGSSRFSIRNRQVAEYLNRHFFSTLLFDLLTEEEDQNYFNRFHISLLAERLGYATAWVLNMPVLKHENIGFFGASTGAAAALVAAASHKQVRAVVSRGGRPDLAIDHLNEVTAPTLLIVGSRDTEVLELNQQALKKLHCKKELAIVQGATHLFEEPGTLEKVAALATNWFAENMQLLKPKIMTG